LTLRRGFKPETASRVPMPANEKGLAVMVFHTTPKLKESLIRIRSLIEANLVKADPGQQRAAGDPGPHP